MRRLGKFLVRNWPLKVGAVLLATVLYSGLVLAQNVRTWTGEVTVDPSRPPTDATLLSDLEPVTEIRYRAPLDVGVLAPASFRATVDLSGVEVVPNGPPVVLPVTLIALDGRVQIVDYQPRELEIRLDPVEVRQMPVTVSFGTVPDGLRIGPPQTEPTTVTVRGASSRVASTRDILARVTIDASALNVDRDVDLLAVDEAGNEVPNLEIEPRRARVRIAVARQLANRTLPVVPQLAGELPAGYEIVSVTVSPLVVTVSGEESVVTRLETAPTDPIDVAGRTNDLDATVGYALPESVSVSGSDQVRVTVVVAERTGSRTFQAGVTLAGARSDLVYSLAAPSINVILGGPISQLDMVEPAQLLSVVQVGNLEAGTHVVPVAVTPPGRLELLSISPTEVSVRIDAPVEEGPGGIHGPSIHARAGFPF